MTSNAPAAHDPNCAYRVTIGAKPCDCAEIGAHLRDMAMLFAHLFLYGEEACPVEPTDLERHYGDGARCTACAWHPSRP